MSDKPTESCEFCDHPTAFFPAAPEHGKFIHRGRDNEAEACTAPERKCSNCGAIKTSPECWDCQFTEVPESAQSVTPEGAQEPPERIRVCVRAGKSDWIGIAYAPNASQPDTIVEYVRADLATRTPASPDVEQVAEQVARAILPMFDPWHIDMDKAAADAKKLIIPIIAAALSAPRPEPKQIVDAVMSCLQQTTEGDVYVDELRAKVLVGRILRGDCPPSDLRANAKYDLQTSTEVARGK
jgi:hypothetical protein